MAATRRYQLLAGIVPCPGGWLVAPARLANATVIPEPCEVLKRLEEENRLGIVLLGRPYHNDPGINHEILEEFQKLGYPVFSQDSLPLDDEIVWKLFGDEVKAGHISHPMDVSDAWKNS